ncbi:DUF4142 domain-containing protein [Streptomyces sp. NPDC002004]
MHISRSMAGNGMVIGAITLTAAALAYPLMLGVQNTANAPARVVANTPYGPLTEADRDFVVKVRSAGLWEYPAGQMALQKGTTPAVRTAGRHLIDGHAGLDATCRAISPQLGITLPNLATPQQQGFVATLASDSGKKFDTDLANILRVTHGQIFPAIAKVRATTKNSLVRQLADQANDTVLDHMTVLEKTGMVDFNSVQNQVTASPTLPSESMTPPPPSPGAPTLVLSPSPSVSAPPEGATPTGN